jgi:hypothetical protein
VAKRQEQNICWIKKGNLNCVIWTFLPYLCGIPLMLKQTGSTQLGHKLYLTMYHELFFAYIRGTLKRMKNSFKTSSCWEAASNLAATCLIRYLCSVHIHYEKWWSTYQQGVRTCSWYSDSLLAGHFGDQPPVDARFSTLAPTPTPPPVQLVPGLFPGGKAASAWHSPPIHF